MRKGGHESNPMVFYRIEVGGELSSDWAEWFGDLTITNLPNGNTLLAGYVVDQAALNGLINKIFALGLSLVAVHERNH